MVRVENLTVSYGPVCALDHLSMTIPTRGIFGLLGRNGAGKTTTIRAILGLVKPDTGKVLVDGIDPMADLSTRKRTSVLLSEDGLVPSLSVGENLSVWADLYGSSRKEAELMTASILNRLGIEKLSSAKVRDLSTGNRRIAAFARTFMLDRDMYILDEPTSSLDPVRAKETRRLIASLAGQKLVLLSTHNLHEAEELCTGIAIIDSGKLVVTGVPGEMEGKKGRYIIRSEEYPVAYNGESLGPEENGCAVLESDLAPADVLAGLIAAGNRIVEFQQARRSLAEVFHSISEEGEK